MNQSTKQVASAHSGSARVAEQGRGSSGRIGWFQLKRSVRTVPVVVRDVDPKDLLEVTATNDQQPVKALGTDGPHPPLRAGARRFGIDAAEIGRADGRRGSKRGCHADQRGKNRAGEAVHVSLSEQRPGSNRALRI